MIAPAMIVSAAMLAQVQLRGGNEAPEPVERVSIEGVTLAGDAPRTIGWDRVKRVDGPLADEAARYLETAELAWRARTRLARGDTALALPIFEDLFDTYRTLDGPTALVVAEGLLQCRLRWGAQIGGVEAWLCALRLRHAGERLAGEPPLPSVIDEETGLVPALPPIWLDSPALAAVAGMRIDENADPQTKAIAQWCAFSAAVEMGASPAPPPTPEHAGASLIADIALSRSPDPSERLRARAALTAGLERDRNTWREAWRRAAIGRSLIKESDPDERRRGVVELLHLPARFADAQPYLAGLALAEAARVMEQLGDTGGAQRARDELQRIDPHHPALRWLEREAPTRGL